MHEAAVPSIKHYIAFEGPIAAGKTRVSEWLSRRIDATLLLEEVEANEFLKPFYEDKQRWALPMQLSFLVSRHAQLSSGVPMEGGDLVSDYTYAKNEIFAGLLLTGLELKLYRQVEARLSRVLQPNLVVYLDADNRALLDRIKLRGRDYETGITEHYLDSLRKAYEQHFAANPEVNVLRCCTTSLDLRSECDLEALYADVERKLDN